MTVSSVGADPVKSQGQRLVTLDSLRGIAAVLVLTFHCWKLGFYTPNGWQAHLWAWSPLNLLVSGRPPVILFFVLSGFVLACSLERPTAGFLVRRICRVYLPFSASILVSVVVYDLMRPIRIEGLSYWFNNLAWTEAPTASLVARHLLMTGLNGDDSLNPVMWSLVYELRISIIFPLLFAVTYRRPVVALVIAIAAHVAAARLVGCRSLQCTPFRGDNLWQSFALTWYFLVFFVAGIVLANYRARLRAVPPLAAAIFSGLGVYCFILPNVGLFGSYLPTDLTFGAGATVLIAMALGSSTWGRVLKNTALMQLGRISYSLYLTHNIILLLVVHAFYGIVNRIELILLVIVLSLVAAEVNYQLVEYPSLRLGRWLSHLWADRCPAWLDRARGGNSTQAQCPGSEAADVGDQQAIENKELVPRI
jgi:peptidoglycan/LPS O-acetylase OafA/YrhL